MNNNTKKRFNRLKKADRQTMANHARISKFPKVAKSAEKFSTEGMTMRKQAEIFHGRQFISTSK